jgi:hypothetical protein
VAVVAAAATLIVGCSGGSGQSAQRQAGTPTPSPADRSFPLPTDGWKPGEPAFLAKSGGVFHAWRTADGACARWGHQRRTALWPAGYTVAFSPTRLIDPAGHVVAREGDWITVGGGLTKGPRTTRCMNGQPETFGVMSDVAVRH